MDITKKTILYSGIYSAKAPRDQVYVSILRAAGYTVHECVSNVKGFAKYAQLFHDIRHAEGSFRFVWVGYLSPAVVLVSFLASRRPIVYNALSSMYESYVLDRAEVGRFSVRALLYWILDFFSFHLADVVLVESDSQKRYLSKLFFVRGEKLRVVFTGVDESVFYHDVSIKKSDVFTVAFRGMFVPATGIFVVLEAAKLLRNEPIRFWISGWGKLKDTVIAYIHNNNLTNVELNTVFLEESVLREKLISAHVLLGQFSNNARLERTIQHKTSEALALGQPFITRDSPSNRELLRDKESCLFVPPEDSRALADAIVYLRSHPDIARTISSGARKVYEERLSPRSLERALLQALGRIL